MHLYLTSPWVPAEWVKAHGLEPRGVWCAENFATQPLPLAAGVCPFANAVVHLAETQPDSAVVFTTHCDQLRRGFDTLAGRSARTFLFNLPATWQTRAAAALFTAELQRLSQFLLTLGGHPPSAADLHQLIIHYRAARQQLLEASAALPAGAYAEALARFHWDGTIAQISNLPHRGFPTSKPSAPPTVSPIPLALLGGPLPRSQWPLLDQVERAGGQIVLNATEAGERTLWASPGLSPALNQTVPELLSHLSHDYLTHCTDVYQRPNTGLYDWLRDRLQSRQVRGIILWHYLGCDLWRAEAQSLREAFGFPILLLDAVGTTDDLPRNAGRLEAFLESLALPA